MRTSAVIVAAVIAASGLMACTDSANAQKLHYDVGGKVKYYEYIISSLDVSYQKVVWYGTVKTTFVP